MRIARQSLDQGIQRAIEQHTPWVMLINNVCIMHIALYEVVQDAFRLWVR